MKRLREACASGEFIVTAELTPPKGPDILPFTERAKGLLGRTHAVNVPDNPAAVMRAGAPAACKVLVDLGHDPILQITGRDRNRLAIQSDLLGAHILGVRNVLCLTGDDVTVGDQKEAKPVFDLRAIDIFNVVAGLNQGRDMAGNRMNGKTVFFPGGAASLSDPTLAPLEEKVRAGARFFQTQPLFHPDRLSRWMERARKFDVKIIAGVLLLRSAKGARSMRENIPGIDIPDSIIEALDRAGDSGASEAGMEIAVKMIEAVRSISDGVHLMAVGAEEKIPGLIDRAGLIPAGDFHG